MTNQTVEAPVEPVEEVQHVAAHAADEAKRVTATAGQEARSVAETAAEQAAQVADRAQQQMRSLVSTLTSDLRSEADAQSTRAAGVLRSYDDQVRALCEGRPQDAPMLVERLQQSSRQANRIADGIEERGFDGVLDDVRGLARRRPGLFLLGCAAAGFVGARMLRAGRSADKQQPAVGELSATPTEYPAGTPAFSAGAPGLTVQSDEVPHPTGYSAPPAPPARPEPLLDRVDSPDLPFGVDATGTEPGR